MQNSLQILKQAKTLIEDKSNWTQGMLARDEKGNACLPQSENAVCFCAAGALYRVVGDSSVDTEEMILSFAATLLYNHDYVTVNDMMRHKDIMAVFDKAIEEAEFAKEVV